MFLFGSINNFLYLWTRHLKTTKNIMETQDLSVFKLIAQAIIFVSITAFAVWFGKRQRERKRQKETIKKLNPHDQIIEKLRGDIFDWNIDNCQLPVYAWAIVSVGFMDGSVKYRPIVGWIVSGERISTKTLDNSPEKGDEYFLTEEGALKAVEYYMKRVKSKMPTSKVITLDSKNTKLQSPWLISIIVISQSMLSFFELAKPFLIGAGVILFIGGIWALINLAINKAIEIDEDDINWPDEDNF